jgi:hypothetical protein
MQELKRIADLPWPLKVAFGAATGLSAIELFVLFQQYTGLKIDPGLATLVGAVIGLAIVGWQTSRGFSNLIKSQENQARLEREGRLHQAEIEQTAEARKEQKDKAALLGALRAEIAHLYGTVADAERNVWLLAQMTKALKDQQQPAATKTIAFHVFDAPVFKANIDNLGVLGAYLGADIIKVLSRANGKEVKLHQEQPMPHDAVITIYEGNRRTLQKWASDLYHVAMRILSYENGTPDPGTLIETEAQRYAEIKEAEKA